MSRAQNLQTELLEVFKNLGLTETQSKTYIALAGIGTAEASRICKIANIHRQDVYRVLKELELRELVLRIIHNPTLYEAVPLKAGMEMLLKKKRQELNNAEAAIEVFGSKKPSIPEESESRFRIYSGKERLVKVTKDNICHATYCVCIALSQENLGITANEYYDVFKEVLCRGIQVRIVAYGTEENLPPSLIQAFDNKPPNFNIKWTQTVIEPTFGVIDKRIAWIYTSEPKTLVDRDIFWTDNAGVAQLFHKYFDYLWKDLQSQTS